MATIPLAWLQAAPAVTDTSVVEVFRVGWREIIGFEWSDLMELGGKILVILFLAWVAYHGLGLLLRRIESNVGAADTGTITVQEQRVRTLVSLVRSVGIVFILLITLFMVLGAVGVDIGPLLAGAGVVGLAISFGSQSLVKDIISGLFILFENQFGVGDVIRVADVSGRVERMTLRIVVMRDLHGVVHIVPNGTITKVSNLTRAFSRAVLEIGVAYREDVDRVMEVMRDVGQQLWDDPEWRPLLTEEISVPGIEAFAESSINIRMVATTVPLKQWDVARELRRRIKKRFDAEGIEIPFPHRTLYWGEDQQPRDGSGASPGDGPAREAGSNAVHGEAVQRHREPGVA